MSPFQVAVGELNRMVGPTLIAVASGSTDRNIAHKWITGERRPTREDERRIYFMVTLLSNLAETQGEDVTRAWFIGANCDGMTTCPAEIIREGRLLEAEISATQLTTDSYS